MTKSKNENKIKRFDKNLSVSSKEEGLWGQDDLNISDTIEFLKNSGFRDVTQKMLRDMDDVIQPRKKDSGYRSFDLQVLKKIQIILTLRNLGFTKKKIVHMLNLREGIVDLLNGKSPNDVNEIKFTAKDIPDENILHNKVLEYRTMLSEVRLRTDDMKRVINIGLDFIDTEDDAAKNELD